MADRQLLGDCAAVGVPDDILDADCIKHPCSDIRHIGIEYGTTGVSLAPTPGPSKATAVLSRSAPAKDTQLATGRDMPLSNNTGSPDPVVRAAMRRPPIESMNVSESTIPGEWVMRWPGRNYPGLSR
jgi:hypothetical protein